jgi:hypothetical protein
MIALSTKTGEVETGEHEVNGLGDSVRECPENPI